MVIKIGETTYPVIITKKAIKNAYIRVNEDLEVVVSVNRLIPGFEINRLLDNNKYAIERMINKQLLKKEKDDHFYYLGEVYDIILNDQFFDVDHDNKKIYTKDLKTIDKHIKKHMEDLFAERLKHNFDYMDLGISYPTLKIRRMKTRWGVCNRKNHSVTLNLELFKHSIIEIDYVIIHELVHFKVFDHSKNFWKMVESYAPEYKKIRKKLKQ